MRRRTGAGAAFVILLGALLVSSASPALVDDPPGLPPPVTEGDVTLVAFDSCDGALAAFRRAALDQVGPYGLPGTGMHAFSVDAIAANPAGTVRESATAARQQQPGYSSTNNYEADADEPDLVKTDGRRIVTLVDGTLRVVDVATKQLTASVRIPGRHATDLLLHGDRALVLTPAGEFGPRSHADSLGPAGAELMLVDLAKARVIGTLSFDGSYLEARQTGTLARVVVRSAPRLEFEYPQHGRKDAKRALRENQDIIRRSSIADWLPRFELRADDTVRSGQLVDCSAINHPATGTGTNLLTVLTIDLDGELGTGDPASITADGGTVYGTGTSLYIADDHVPFVVGAVDVAPAAREQRTTIYQFDTSGEGTPTYVAAGEVTGRLLNQYALSEHDGYLRVATTTGQLWRARPSSQSALTVLARRGETLAPVGRVGGLGKGERIYSVRYLGDTAYIVTFRETDPLYALDLSDPANPRTTGELKIIGYSAYLHPVGENRLLGVGQEATDRGRTTGTQVSLFDTGDPRSPSRLAQHHVENSHSEVEHDPHAFLHWPDTGMVVLPVTSWYQRFVTQGDAGYERNYALVLRVDGDRLVEVGGVSHPGGPWRGQIRRSLVVGDALWTVSGAGVMASDLDTLRQRAWVPFR